jgi:ABC-type sugar transport system ATPase subunit
VIEVSDAGARLQLGNGCKVLATVEAAQLQVGETVEVGLRPEHCEVLPAGVAPGTDDTALDAEITLVEHLGESNLLYLKMDDGQELIVRGDGDAEVRLGDSVIVRAAPSALYLFKADGSACTRLNPGNMRSAHAR